MAACHLCKPQWSLPGMTSRRWLLLQGKASGGRAALWVRARLQTQLFQLGCFLQRHAGKVLFVAILVLSTFCVGLKSAQVHTRVDQLWVQGNKPSSTSEQSSCVCVSARYRSLDLFIIHND
ncbi:hypothetical protein PR048_026345 [Dryococelus australis]|uniref:Uncharacterized protein n=1 Tax=Dryococelus australis TaxID=614101 RepID=A0ABQ9GL17_9NEOP|nr:hypothetical protein PR048_026345 [Dryococelus australis]